MKEKRTDEVRRRARGSMMAGLMLSLFTAALDSTVVATAMPTIAFVLGGAGHYTWPMTAYLVSSTVSTLLCGGIAFHFGLKRAYTAGLAVFALASALCAAAPTIEALAAFRLVQGIGGGILEAGVFIAAAMMIPPRDRGPYLGAASAMYGAASIAGPVIGGAVVQGLSWQAIFMANIPIALVAFALALKGVPGMSAGRQGSRFDLAGSMLASLCVLILVAAFSLLGDAGGLLGFGVLVLLFGVLSLLLRRIESSAVAPVVPMGLFRRRRVVAGFVSGFCAQFGLMAGVAYLPRFLQETLDVGAASSGAALIPMTLALMVGSNLSGAFFRATGRLRAMAATSSFAVLLSAAAFAAGARDLTVSSVLLLGAALGFGVGMGMPVSNLSAQTGAEKGDAGRATSMAMFFRGFGGTVSTAVCGALAPTASAGGTAAVFCAVAVSSLVGLATSVQIEKKIAS